MRRLYVKSAVDLEQLKVRNKYNKEVEIQLFGDLMDREIEEILETIEKSDSRIVAVHSPIVKSDELYIHQIFNQSKFDMIEKTFMLADVLGEKYGILMPVIFHNARSKEELIGEGHLSGFTLKLNRLLTNYKNTALYLENLIPVVKMSDGKITTCSAFLDETPKLVQLLRNVIGGNRVYSLLDTAHAEISMSYMKAIGLNYDLEDYFKWYEDTIGLLHLSWGEGFGYGVNEHAYKLTEEHEDYMIKFQKLYEKYNYECPITLEVLEEDYLDPQWYVEAERCFRKVEKELLHRN